MSEIRLILSRASLARAAFGSFMAAGLIFMAGMVVGFALRGEPLASSAAVDATAGPSPQPPALPAVVEQTREAESPPVVAPASRPQPEAPPEPRVASALPSEENQAEVPETTLPEGAGYAVQFGAFRSVSNARSLQADVDRRGYRTIIVRARSRSGQWLHHVQLAERVRTEPEARAMAERLEHVESLVALAAPVRESG